MGQRAHNNWWYAMPSKSGKQHRFMEAVAHNPTFAKRVGVPQSVGRDFANADKANGRVFSAKRRTGKTKAWKGV